MHLKLSHCDVTNRTQHDPADIGRSESGDPSAAGAPHTFGYSAGRSQPVHTSSSSTSYRDNANYAPESQAGPSFYHPPPHRNGSHLAPLSPDPPSPTAHPALPNVQTAFRIPSSRGRQRSDSANGQERAALSSLPLPGDAHNPLGVLAEASATLSGTSSERMADRGSENRRPSSRPDDSKLYEKYYAASPTQPVARNLLVEAPHIMRLITPAEAESLFEVYWKSIHPHLPCLDREHSSAIAVACRSNFLFNASRCDYV
jgi:hypothetical protein